MYMQCVFKLYYFMGMWVLVLMVAHASFLSEVGYLDFFDPSE
jgi:hypothetical protein